MEIQWASESTDDFVDEMGGTCLCSLLWDWQNFDPLTESICDDLDVFVALVASWEGT